jgi:hypothetical protein
MVIANAVANADLSCARDNDCEIVSNSTDCHASCGVLAGPMGQAQIAAAIADENAGRCAGFDAMGCVALIPPCVPPPPHIRCAAGRCISDYGAPMPDAGSTAPDASVPVAGCLDQTLVFGWSGGFVAYSDVITISPCRSFALQRTGVGDPIASAMCQNQIPAATTDAIDAALADPAVQAAFAGAPQLFGVDQRPTDGAVYRIELGGAVIEVGGPCGSGGGLPGSCTAIPPAVADLVSRLQALVDAQKVIPNCDQLP